ncbi:hypothetical protein QFZ30_002250 [Arthrobacter pascens]|uniref:hypothetical protein n=1 Tax=Arthrobacter pascens TaxID=1677 RepID=UPI002790F5D4|nr:hypothetical protein [Arthrobacter pascens]MDQ0678868.1 hypothetical protein [Arthrobacter pascens]
MFLLPLNAVRALRPAAGWLGHPEKEIDGQEMPSRNSVIKQTAPACSAIEAGIVRRTGPTMMDFQNDKSKIASRQFMEILEFRNMIQSVPGIEVLCLFSMSKLGAVPPRVGAFQTPITDLP